MVRGISNLPRCVDWVRPSLLSKVKLMSDHVVPHFHNDAGVSVIEIGSQEFMCVGANPPFDHPHVFLGLRPRLAPRAVTPEAINIMSARAGGEIARLPLGEAAGLRAGAPYWVMHRADLQGALQAQVNEHPDIDLRLGCQFEDVTSHAKGLTVVQRRGNARQQELAIALVGADGIWSAVRNHLFPEVQPQFSGLIAWRGTLDATTLPREYTAAGVQLRLGPDAR